MDKFSKFKSSIENEKRTLKGGIQTSNPMAEKVNSDLLLNDYTQTTPRQKYDQDIAEILEIVRILNNMVPTRMPEYSFDIEEINGERYYRPDGTLLLIREYDSDLIRDYYAAEKNEEENNKYSVPSGL